MTFRDSPWPDGTPCWADVMVPDRKKAMAFYGALFGWGFDEGPEETGFYTMASLDGRTVVGLMQTMPGQEDMPAAWTVYLAASDIDKTTAAAAEAGGHVVSPPMDVMTAGRMAVIADPAGAVFGLWQGGDHTGMQVANVPGAITWNEAMSHDYETAKAFYGNVFGYGSDDMSGPGFNYAVLTVGGEPVGGIGTLPEDVPAEVPAHWTNYFAVVDTDATVAKVVELGGTVTMPPFDSPQGRLASVTDDQGAAFSVIALKG
jgi:predicted enzyme related to lactoylglutathione lyase